MVISDEDDPFMPSKSRAYRRLRIIADQLGKPMASFYGLRSDAEGERLELLRLWDAVTDPVGRQRILTLARQEAKWCGQKDGD